MKRLNTLLLFAAVLSVGTAFKPVQGRKDADAAWISPEIRPYMAVIDTCRTSSVEYVLGLFDRYDVVILGDRDHRDTVQFDLFEAIISDPRFVEKVGHVMTEFGCFNMSGEADSLITADFATERDFDLVFWKKYPDFDYSPMIENVNFKQYFYFLHRLNRTLPPERKVHVTMLDMPFSWRRTENLTHEQFMKSFYTMWQHPGRNREQIFGNNALTALNQLFDGPDPRKKALIIVSYPHLYAIGKKRGDNNFYVGQIIRDRYPGRVANILNHKAYMGRLTQRGKWDAAFEACGGHVDAGFDLAGTPFGEDYEDLRRSHFRGRRKQREIYDGMVIYGSLYDQVFALGIEPPDGDTLFKAEIVRRDRIWGNQGDTPEEVWDYYTKFRIFSRAGDSAAFIRQIRRYYRPAQTTAQP